MTRLVLIIAAIAALALSLTLTTRPVAAGAPPATLNPAHVGTDSSDGDIGDECDEQGEQAPEPGQVLWHFILNGLNPGITSAIEGHFNFTPNSQDQTVDSSKWNPGGDTHHFYVYTDGDAVLDGASADIGASDYNNFNLSHLCHGDEVEETPTPTPATPTPTPATPTPTPEGSQGGGSGTPEGSQAGGTGTPAGSVPDTSASMPGVGGPLATLIFGAILLSSLGALAYANVRAARSR
jgi:hypothetical protein